LKQNYSKSTVEETLDPKLWEELKGLGRRMVDDMFDYLENIRSKPMLSPTKEAVDEIYVPLSDEGEGEEAVYEVFRRSILPYFLILTSPRLWRVVAGQGSPYGMLVELLRGA
jgi:aromatic-L-amino-acid decarboxylase